MESAFRGSVPDDLRLIETFGCRDGRIVRRARHLSRLERTARALTVPFDLGAIEGALEQVPGEGALRVRLTLDLQGRPRIETWPLASGPDTWRIAVHAERLDPENPWLRIKTSERQLYDRARMELPDGIDEWVFLNTRGEVCEGTITNVFLRREGGFVTPPANCGLLPGVLREEMLAKGAREAVLRLKDLENGQIYMGNSLRGLIRACLVT